MSLDSNYGITLPSSIYSICFACKGKKFIFIATNLKRDFVLLDPMKKNSTLHSVIWLRMRPQIENIESNWDVWGKVKVFLSHNINQG